MNCESCPYSDQCKQPNKDRPACLMLTRLEKVKAMAKIPKKYRNCFVDNLPIQRDNPQAYKIIIRYCATVMEQVLDNNNSLYLYSKPNKDNPLGCGTGKTTAACTILNVFLAQSNWKHLKGERKLEGLPALFVRCSDFQNIYNAQFRDQAGASMEYYYFKNNMKTCALLVLDDIAIRSCTEAFLNEMYEVINHRNVEELTTIYTSNVPMEDVTTVLDERIASRMKEDCFQIAFSGVDHRKGGV